MANTKESRKDEKYRCFLKNRDDDYYLGVSITPECNVLKTVEKVRQHKNGDQIKGPDKIRVHVDDVLQPSRPKGYQSYIQH